MHQQFIIALEKEYTISITFFVDFLLYKEIKQHRQEYNRIYF